jgi:hypothetical protein
MAAERTALTKSRLIIHHSFDLFIRSVTGRHLMNRLESIRPAVRRRIVFVQSSCTNSSVILDTPS